MMAAELITNRNLIVLQFYSELELFFLFAKVKNTLFVIFVKHVFIFRMVCGISMANG